MSEGKGQEGSWCWEVVQLRLRKTDKFGNPYTGVASVTIANGNANLEGLLCENFTLQDARDIKKIGTRFGYSKCTKTKAIKIG